MSYTRPDAATADATFVGAAAYTRPDAATADASFLSYPQGLIAAPSMLGAPAITAAAVAGLATAATPLGAPAILANNALTGVIAAPGMLGAPALLGAQTAALASVPSMMGVPAVFAAHMAGVLAAPSMIGTPALLGSIPLAVWVSAASPLGTPAILALHDFSAALGDSITRFVMDLETPDGPVRVPISSWQATLQSGSSSYVQCVIPACQPWLDAINAATEFVIYRRADIPGTALQIEYEMARSATEQATFDQGPQRYTCTLSGYPDAFAEDLNPPTVYDRTLVGVRSVSSGNGLRVRCAVDWLLRPGHRAYVGAVPFVVRYINYYATGGDSYMDVGE